MNILEKYELHRAELRDGDLMLFHGTHLLAKIIQSSDKNENGTNAYWNHIGIIFEKCGRLFIQDSNRPGVHPEILSERIKKYSSGDFCVLRPVAHGELIQAAMEHRFARAEEGIKYDFMGGLRGLIYRRWNKDLKFLGTAKRDICSEYTAPYALELEMVMKEFAQIKFPFPQDYIREQNLFTTKLLFTE